MNQYSDIVKVRVLKHDSSPKDSKFAGTATCRRGILLARRSIARYLSVARRDRLTLAIAGGKRTSNTWFASERLPQNIGVTVESLSNSVVNLSTELLVDDRAGEKLRHGMSAAMKNCP